jgi:transposase
MSMKTRFPAEIPEETRRLVEPLLAEASVYRLVGKEIDQILNDEDFKDRYAEEGRPAVGPVVLGLVIVFQFMEGLPDRAAAETAVMRLGWKYGLRQELDWGGFHYSDLCNFRKRLLGDGRERQMWERVVGYLRGRGYIKERGRQRTDATHIVGHVERLSRLELVWETIRIALGAVISTDAPWVIERIPTGFVQTHTERRRDYRLTKDEVAEELATAGQEGYWLVGQIEAHGTPELQSLPEMAQLKRVLDEQFPRGEDGQAAPRPPGQCKGDVLTSPHDPEVRYGAKGGKGWVGYKLQVTETADDVGHFITDIEIVPAMTQDNQCREGIQERLVAQDIPPAKQSVDQAFMSGGNINRQPEGRP